MIINSNVVGIVADDLTGANDTALQFHLKGANTQILLDEDSAPINLKTTQTWAISTETRNIEPDEAFEKTKSAANFIKEQIKK